MLFAVSGGVRVLLPKDWVKNDRLMCLDWLAGAVRSKGKGALNITGFNQCITCELGEQIWSRMMECCRVLQITVVTEIFKCWICFVV